MHISLISTHKVNTRNGTVHVEPHRAFEMQLGVVTGLKREPRKQKTNCKDTQISYLIEFCWNLTWLVI